MLPSSHRNVLRLILFNAVLVRSAMAGSIDLASGWTLQSQAAVADAGTVISQTGYNTAGWYPVTVPCTVMAGLLSNNIYTDVFFGTNLQAVPDLTTNNWWYRDQFLAPTNPAGQFWLRSKGIAYRAQIWVNGVQVDSNAEGTMVSHEYNVTSLISSGRSNALAVLVTPPLHNGHTSSNLTFWYADWNPDPPDWNAGLWGKVLLDATGPVALRDPYVKTVLPLPDTNSASLTIYVDAVNGATSAVTGTLTGLITKPGCPSISVTQNVTLNPNERREISFDPSLFAQLQVANPVLWWPIPLGNPELYNLQLTFTVNGQVRDKSSLDFGIRQFTDYITPRLFGHTYRGYQVNGQDLLIRGSAYVWDMFMRWDTNVNQAHIDYARDMGLNMIRFEGILGNEDLYDRADRAGITLMPGFVCCTFWAQWGKWSSHEVTVATASLESQMRLLRAHPSAMIWAYGSDELPPASLLSIYKNTTTNLHWQNPTLDNVASYNNSSGSVPKMDGPYVWEPPLYWYADTNNGGAFGFCAEQGAEAVPPEESLRKFIGEDDLWPIGSVYGYHCGKGIFGNLTYYSPGVTNRYGPTTNVTQYAQRAQLLNYESQRAQFEAYAANAYFLSQGTIFWMMNNAWPSVHWNLYDYYFKPGGGYFGTKKALEPVHILYNYKNSKVMVFNGTLAPTPNLTASIKVYNLPDLTLKFSNSVTRSFPPNASTSTELLPVVSGLTTTYLIRLQLTDAGGNSISENVYAYSTKPDALGKSSTYYNTTVTAYADLTGLNSLPLNYDVSVTAGRRIVNGQEFSTIAVTNDSPDKLAYAVRVEVTAGDGGLEVLPIVYKDNYFTLWPGEAKTITAVYASSALAGQPAFVRLTGYNVSPLSITNPAASPIVLTLDKSSAGQLTLSWNSAAAKSYQPEVLTNFAAGNWTPLGSSVTGNGSTNTVTDTISISSPRFYRVREMP